MSYNLFTQYLRVQDVFHLVTFQPSSPLDREAIPTCFRGSRVAQGVQVGATLPENGQDYDIDGVDSSKTGVGRQVRLLESPGEGRIGRETPLCQNCVAPSRSGTLTLGQKNSR